MTENKMEIVAGKCPIEAGGNCPLRPQGEWIRKEDPRYAYDREHGDEDAGVSFHCSECGKVGITSYNFCPICGADKGGKEE